jgi:hypothetical protein
MFCTVIIFFPWTKWFLSHRQCWGLRLQHAQPKCLKVTVSNISVQLHLVKYLWHFEEKSEQSNQILPLPGEGSWKAWCTISIYLYYIKKSAQTVAFILWPKFYLILYVSNIVNIVHNHVYVLVLRATVCFENCSNKYLYLFALKMFKSTDKNFNCLFISSSAQSNYLCFINTSSKCER